MPQILIGNTGSGIFHKNDSMPGILYPIPQKNIPLCSKLLGVINQIIHNLLQTYGIRNHGFSCTFRKVGAQFHPLRHAQPLGIVDLLHDKCKIIRGESEVHCPRLYT